MTFPCRNVPGFCQQIFALLFLVSTNSSFFMKSLLSNTQPALLYSFRCTPSIEPQSAKFLHTVCQRFCQHSEPCLYPCFSIFQQTMVKGWRGAGGQV
jgi:hypothetical protein